MNMISSILNILKTNFKLQLIIFPYKLTIYNFIIVMSVIKQITYREHLPVLLGNTAMKAFPAVRVSRAHKRPKNTRFAKFPDAEEVAARSVRFTVAAMDDPSIRQEFITSAYRFGHAMIPDQLITADGNLNSNSRRELKDNYFDPDMVFQMGPGACLRGAMAGNTNTVSGIYSDATQSHLFKPNNFGHGVDLLSINLAVCCLLVCLFICCNFSAVVNMELEHTKRSRNFAWAILN